MPAHPRRQEPTDGGDLQQQVSPVAVGDACRADSRGQGVPAGSGGGSVAVNGSIVTTNHRLVVRDFENFGISVGRGREIGHRSMRDIDLSVVVAMKCLFFYAQQKV